MKLLEEDKTNWRKIKGKKKKPDWFIHLIGVMLISFIVSYVESDKILRVLKKRITVLDNDQVVKKKE